jgi:diacylglycerol O-acyltransferase / wax synthase
MRRLSAQDATFLHVEDAVSNMSIGSVAIFEGPPPPPGEFGRMVEAKLPRIPRYRQTVRFVPLALGRPVWVDDPHFNLAYHLRRSALPRPGGDQELRALVGRVMSQKLDRDRPLWELWAVEGLQDDRWALVTKIHHCMVDGVSGAELMSVILDSEPDPPLPGPVGWKPERQPSGAELAVRALGARAQSPAGALATVGDSIRHPRRTLAAGAEEVEGLRRLGGVARPAGPAGLNGPIGPHRRWDWARSSLDDVRAIRRTLGGTVNDVVLTAIAGGFRALLERRGEPTDRPVRTLVPVSVRGTDEHDHLDNRVSAMFAELPVGVADPVERLAVVREQLADLKASHEADAGDALVGLAGYAPAMALAVTLRTATRVPQRSVNTVTTNVPGPRTPLYAAGRRMLHCFPYVPLAAHVRIGVAIFSYASELNFGVTGDYDTAPDIGVLCRGIEDDLAALLARAHAAQPARAVA